MSYSLVKRLNELGNENIEAKKLYATWTLNQPMFAKALSTVNYNFPHYSMHEESHSVNIIKEIEKILGDERIKVLEATDIWMILMAAYLHDIGMSIANKTLSKEWETNEFQEYLLDTSKSNDKDLCQAAKYILNVQTLISSESNININNNKEWPVKVRNSCVLLAANYFRRNHALMSKEWIDKNNEGNQRAMILGYQLIPDRLLLLLGNIVLAHQLNFDDTLKLLPFCCNGVGTDKVHPRLIASMLRLGDLLDLDNGRFDFFWERVSGKLPYSSFIHKQKHASVTHFFVSPTKIELSADCENEAIYREMRSWVNWLKEEIKNLASSWVEIVPNQFSGGPPIMGAVKLSLQGKEGKNEQVDLRFEISQEKAFEIIEGSGIYDNKLVFLRELIQNATDASKIQMWKDIIEGEYDYDGNNNILTKAQYPNDIPKEVWKRYPINIKIEGMVSENDDSCIRISVKDRGYGINWSDLRGVASVGRTIFNKDKESLIKSMPFWLKPTGAFGLGLQSVFLVSNEFKLKTKTMSERGKKISFVSRKNSGYIIVNDDDDIKRGTEVIVDIPVSLLPASGGYDVEKEYDYFTSEERDKYFLIIKDYINKMMLEASFDVNIVIPQNENFSYKKYGSYKKMEELEETSKLKDYNENLRYAIEKNGENGLNIHIWEKYIGSYMIISPQKYWSRHSDTRENNRRGLAFRDVVVSGASLYNQYISLFCNLLKPETKDVLNIARNKISSAEHEKFKDQIRIKILPIILEIFFKYFDSNKECKEEWLWEQFFSLLMLANLISENEMFEKYQQVFIENVSETLYFSERILCRSKDESKIRMKDFFSLKKIVVCPGEGNTNLNMYSKMVSKPAGELPECFVDSEVVIAGSGLLGTYINDNFMKKMFFQEVNGRFMTYYEKGYCHESEINIVNTDTRNFIIKQLTYDHKRGRTVIRAINPYAKYLAIKKFPKDLMVGELTKEFYIISPFCKKNIGENEEIIKEIKDSLSVEGLNNREDKKKQITEIVKKHSDNILSNKLVEWVFENNTNSFEEIDENKIRNTYIELLVEYYTENT